MSGGLMQLVAVGAQDVYLTGNPQITLFKGVYKRHTNFSMEPIPLTPSGTADWGKTAEITVTRNADLVGEMWLRLEVTNSNTNVTKQNSIPFGHNIIDYVEVEIGGQKIDKHYGSWLSMDLALNETTDKLSKTLQLVNGMSGDTIGSNKTDVVYVPLRFWFNKYKSLPLPLIALQYHEVKISVKFQADNADVFNTPSGGSISNCELITNYIYLDTEERKRFAQQSHEYLIEQVQSNRSNSWPEKAGQTAKIDLNFNHPCKYIAWQNIGANRYTSLYGNTCHAGDSRDAFTAQLKLNGQDRLHKALDQDYFHKCQKIQHFTNSNDLTMLGAGAGTVDSAELGTNDFNTNVYVYSFAVNASEHQPSGTCNFSRIDNSQLVLSRSSAGSATSSVDVYAVNYNVLRIMSGMGGLAYSN